MKIPAWVRNEEKWKKDCHKLRALAHRIMNGEESMIEGSRKMLKYRFWMREKDNKNFDIFAVVDSESNHLPVGNVRQHWAEDALLKFNEEIIEIEKLYNERVVNSATEIYNQYDNYIKQFDKVRID